MAVIGVNSWNWGLIMGISRPTLTELDQRAAADIDRHSDGDPNLRGSIEFALKNAVVGLTHGLYGMLAYQEDQLFDATADEANLKRRMAEYGLTLTEAKVASGSITVTGNNGKVIPVDTKWSIGAEVYKSTAQQAIASGTATVPITAIEAGVNGNAAAGAPLQIVVPISGVDSKATVGAGGLTAGADIESLDRGLVRLQERKASPPRGGTSEDWTAWCKAGHQDVTRVWPQSNKDNLGATVYGVVTCFVVTDELASPIPSAAILTAITNYVEQPGIRPVGMKSYYILAPTQKLLDITFATLSPNTQAVKDAITVELKDLLKSEAVPGGTIKLTHVRAAISLAAGEDDYTMDMMADFTTVYGEFPVLGTVTWPGA
jgi:uncharacterized phage protein gp47/JayE